MHGQQRKVVFRSHDSAGSAILRKQLQPGDGSVSPDQVKPHQPREHHADKHRDQRQAIILFADDLMIRAENILPNKFARGSVLVNDWGRGIRHLMASPNKPTRAEIIADPSLVRTKNRAMALLRL